MNTLSETDIYQQQLDTKAFYLRQLLSEFSLPELKIYSSPITHYRMRAEFRIWHNGDDLYHVMYDKNTKLRVKVENFPAATLLINRVMKAIMPLLKYNHVLRHLLFQVDYLSTLSEQILVTLIYHKKLNSEWIISANILKRQLQQQGFNIKIVGRATNQKIAIDNDYVDEEFSILNKKLIYRQVENSFTQPNAIVNIKMLEWAVNITKELSGDLLELYCGNGNFSIALAQNFRRVLATEIAKVSVYSAQHNIAVNHIDNLIIIRLSAAEFTSAIRKERQFNRLKHINLYDYQCDTVLVDPPRGGLDFNTINLLKEYQTIIYISCNPLTLYENLKVLSQSHYIHKIALFDQFPYTKHIETGIVLQKFN